MSPWVDEHLIILVVLVTLVDDYTIDEVIPLSRTRWPEISRTYRLLSDAIEI